eukprot:TRINITY_DN13945_c0_g1_i1.p1 TRINITY_DN13945_c0_g1~~TRINITY_DN13945_c0_g1_i1.p1  ORF type:complete len:423 (-),score=100.54 TRINITY_DN13945_c0_g1_i1:11-1279(-)
MHEGAVQLFKPSTSIQVSQGALEDCWLLGALVAMHQGGAGLEQLFVEWADGHVVVKFHKNGEWVPVEIDDRIPCDEERRPVFACDNNEGCFGVCLIEKAYAKLHHSYKALEYGMEVDALGDLTGGCTAMVPVDAPEHIPIQGMQGASLWERMLCALEQGALMGASSLSNKQPVAATGPATPDTHNDNSNKITAKVTVAPGRDAELCFGVDEDAEALARVFVQTHGLDDSKHGAVVGFIRHHQEQARAYQADVRRARAENQTCAVISNHTYAIVALKEESLAPHRRLAQLQNPWGAGVPPEAEPGSDSGCFWLEFDSFCSLFNVVHVCLRYDQDTVTSVGVETTLKAGANRDTWGEFAQFSLKYTGESPTEITVTLSQEEMRLLGGKNDYDALAPVSYTHLRAHETVLDLVCRLLLEKKKKHA